MASELSRRRVAWDMETGDPDDFLTLLLLLDHPWVDLVAVTVTPGTPEQVGLVGARWSGSGAATSRWAPTT